MPLLFNPPRGGAPTPLLDNPSVSICIMLFLLNVVLLLLSTGGLAVHIMLKQVCEEFSLALFMALVGLESLVGSMAFMELGLREHAPDIEWLLRGLLIFFLNAVQVITMIWGGKSVYWAVQVEECKQTARELLAAATGCLMMFGAIVAMTLLAIHLVFYPSFVLQISYLRKNR
mmetsp:Transcript_79952/g.232116  ORF Transcript_79952/g.232116 Transcript_79952/m.232116 type:complete len:173 (+) Transcript_79952:146-664(+)